MIFRNILYDENLSEQKCASKQKLNCTNLENNECYYFYQEKRRQSRLRYMWDTIISRQIFDVLILSVKCVPIYPMIVSKCGRKFD